MIILVGSQKGGPGKSTIAANLAVEYSRRGADVVLVDADAQASVTRWISDREDAGHTPAIPAVQKTGNIAKGLQELDGRYGLVIVDVAGKDSPELRSAMLVADLMIATVRPSQFDLDTLEHLSEVIEAARLVNETLDVRLLITQAPTDRHATEIGETGEYLADYPAFTPLTTVIHTRKAYRDVLAEGLSVVEWKNQKASEEIQALVSELEQITKDTQE